MTSKSLIAVLAASIACGGLVALATPALAKKKAATATYTTTKQVKRSAKKCKQGPTPPMFRNPRYMNRVFIKKPC